MKDIDKSSVTYLILLIVTVSVWGMILYPIFDWILCSFITKSTFAYSIYNHIIDPILFGCIFGLISWFVDKKKK